MKPRHLFFQDVATKAPERALSPKKYNYPQHAPHIETIVKTNDETKDEAGVQLEINRPK